MTLLPAELCGGTVTFKEFYLFVRSIICSNDLKFWMICEMICRSERSCIQLADFKRIYKDFLSSNAPCRVALKEITSESIKMCLELSAEPAQLQRLLRLAQIEAHELCKSHSSDLSFLYCLVMNFIHLSYEINHKSCKANTTDHHLKMQLSKASNKLEEVDAQRSVMQRKAKIERHQQGIDTNKLESVQWFDYSGCPKKYSD